MIIRIVKMEFEPENIQAFLNYFETVKQKIKDSSGCEFLELYRDKANSDIFFTYSKWEKEKDLQLYRESTLFMEIWTTTKPMFRSKAQAWSVDTLHTLK